MNKTSLCSWILLLIFFTACGKINSAYNEQTQLPDSTLISIRDGFDTRVADLYNVQKGKTLGSIFSVKLKQSEIIQSLIPPLKDNPSRKYLVYKRD